MVRRIIKLYRSENFIQFLATFVLMLTQPRLHPHEVGGWKHNLNMDITTFHAIPNRYIFFKLNTTPTP